MLHNFFTVMSYQLLALIVAAISLWAYTQKYGNISIVDRFWSLFFLLNCLMALMISPGRLENFFIIFAPLLLWALRLSLHITARSYGKGEDRRYLALEAKYKSFSKYWSLFLVFILQALLSLIISLPLTLAIISFNDQYALLPLFIGAALFLFGFIFETIADYQLASFQKRRKNREEILDRGLWAYSRHPNYFGETVLWWGLYLISCSISGAYWSIVSPILMTYLLVNVSGVAMLDSTLKKSKPKYSDYIKTTSSFIPWPKNRR